MNKFTLEDAARNVGSAKPNTVDGLTLEYGGFRRAQLAGFDPGKTLDIPTPWGHWGVTMKADGGLELYAATLTGATRVIHIAPKVTNVVDILPVKM